MSIRLLHVCDGHRHGQPCRGAYSSSIGYSERDTDEQVGRHVASIARLPDGWRRLPDGGALCHSSGHDEDPPEPDRCAHTSTMRQGDRRVCADCGAPR